MFKHLILERRRCSMHLHILQGHRHASCSLIQRGSLASLATDPCPNVMPPRIVVHRGSLQGNGSAPFEAASGALAGSTWNVCDDWRPCQGRASRRAAFCTLRSSRNSYLRYLPGPHPPGWVASLTHDISNSIEEQVKLDSQHPAVCTTCSVFAALTFCMAGSYRCGSHLFHGQISSAKPRPAGARWDAASRKPAAHAMGRQGIGETDQTNSGASAPADWKTCRARCKEAKLCEFA